jgi:hypothetical protein
MPCVLIGAPAWRITGVTRGALFPRRSDTVRRPQRPCRSSPRSARSRAGWLGGVAVGYAVVSVTALARVPGEPSVRPWPCRAAGALTWPVVAGCSRRRAPSRGCHRPHTCDSARPERSLTRGRAAAPGGHRAGMSGHSGAGGVPTRWYRCSRPAVQ